MYTSEVEYERVSNTSLYFKEDKNMKCPYLSVKGKCFHTSAPEPNISSCINDDCVVFSPEFCTKCRSQIEAETRKEALIEGITLYAWWKDGVQYVGSCGTTLKEAITKIERNGG